MPAPRRALGLDALRGLAIVLMCLSGVVPNWLPNAMYHGYYPRFLPAEDGSWTQVENPWQFRADWPSYTWVDWVFPVFLFAMGAAIPLAMSRRLDRGVSRVRLVPGVVWRWLTLVGFAVYVQQVAPGSIQASTDDRKWLLALVGFALLFPVFTRLPKGWHTHAVRAVRGAGVLACVAFVAYLNTGHGKEFNWNTKDIIILLLAHGMLFAGLAWLLVPKRGWLRLLLMLPVMFLAHHQAMNAEWRLLGGTFDGLNRLWNLPREWLDLSPYVSNDGWLNAQWFNLAPLWDFTWLKFLWLVVPGTVAGDLLVKWMNREAGPAIRQPAIPWGTGRHLALAALLLAAIGLVFWGAKDYGQVLFRVFGYPLHTPYAGLILGGLPLALAGLLVYRPGSKDDLLLMRLYGWGAVTLLVGLVLAVAPQVTVETGLRVGFESWRFTGSFDPGRFAIACDTQAFFEGGIKKGPPATLSYYFISLGLSFLALIVLTLAVDRSRVGRWLLGFLVLTGQNPMLAYVGIRNLLQPVVNLPFAVAFGLGNHKTFDQLGFYWLPEQIAAWAGRPRYADEPWVLFIWSAVKTLLLAWFTAVATLCRVVWRS
jgi:predicted acyltransferase